VITGKVAIEQLIVVDDNLRISTDSDIEFQAINACLDRKREPR
jgi:hypothetical protein